jgi:hypothetical protein
MAATTIEIDDYITNIRSAITDYGEALAIKQMIGRTDLYCDRMKLMLLSAYLDCIVDYFEQDTVLVRYDVNNFFTTTEIRDIMQHINNICKTNYILVNL